MRNALRIFFLLCGLCLAAACSVDVEDGVGPRVPVPNVAGRAVRNGVPADDLKVELRSPATAETQFETDTDFGDFRFADVPAGLWEVKVSGDDAGDFDSVSREFLLEDDGGLHELTDLEIWAFGCEALTPEDGAVVPPPNPFAALAFNWTLPVDAPRGLDWVRVQVYDDGGDQVWSSEKLEPTTELLWNGLGNEGDYASELVPPGDYYWRLKVEFSDSLEARLDPRDLVIE